jgi:hypothetical protein
VLFHDPMIHPFYQRASCHILESTN